jgi:hypothetical protein
MSKQLKTRGFLLDIDLAHAKIVIWKKYRPDETEKAVGAFDISNILPVRRLNDYLGEFVEISYEKREIDFYPYFEIVVTAINICEENHE